MEQPLTEQVAIVTGAGRGVGAAIAGALAAAGARVAVNDINPDRAEQTAAHIRAQGGQALGIPADVANKFQCVHLIETARQAWGRLDIVVNNAAVQPRDSVLKMDEWAWQRCLDVNLKGTFFMSQLAGRVMADENRQRGGVIINIGAPAGLPMTLPGRAAYAASKAGVAAFAQECALEFAAFGVRVNTLLPGVLDTAVANLAPEMRQKIAPEHICTAGEVAEAVLYLCSVDAGEITGRTIPVSGSQNPRQ